jgi:hypothetical protein
MPLNKVISLRRRAEEDAALAAGLDKREQHRPRALRIAVGMKRLAGDDDRLAAGDDPPALRQLEIAAHRFSAAVSDVPAAGGRGFNDQAVEELGSGVAHQHAPRLEGLASQVEVEHLQVAGHRAADQTEGPVAVGEPAAHLGLGREPLLIRLPGAQRHALMVAFPPRGKHAQAGSQIGTNVV